MQVRDLVLAPTLNALVTARAEQDVLHGVNGVQFDQPPLVTTVHGCVLHGCVRERSEGHGVPPCLCGVHVRVAVATPPPQENEQVPNADHSDTTASTGGGAI